MKKLLLHLFTAFGICCGLMDSAVASGGSLIHVRNKTTGKIEFKIYDGDASGKPLVDSYLPIAGAAAIFPVKTTNTSWLVRYRKENGKWSEQKMSEVDGWLELK